MPIFLIASYTWWQKLLATHPNPFPFFFTEMQLSLSTWDCNWAALVLLSSSRVRQAHMSNFINGLEMEIHVCYFWSLDLKEEACIFYTHFLFPLLRWLKSCQPRWKATASKAIVSQFGGDWFCPLEEGHLAVSVFGSKMKLLSCNVVSSRG